MIFKSEHLDSLMMSRKYSRTDASSAFSLYASTFLGKKVYGSVYIHKSLIQDVMNLIIKQSARDMLEFIQSKIDKTDWNYDIIVFRKSKPKNIAGRTVVGSIEYVQCPTWDEQFEPTVGDRVVITASSWAGKRWDDVAVISWAKKKALAKNPQIFHRRHLFVAPNYTGFDIIADKARVQEYLKNKPDPRRMGRRDYWDKFLESHGMSK